MYGIRYLPVCVLFHHPKVGYGCLGFAKRVPIRFETGEYFLLYILI
jgi:hypothetical protein